MHVKEIRNYGTLGQTFVLIELNYLLTESLNCS